MFHSLRLRLTLLYLLAGLVLIALVGSGSYRLMSHYLQVTTDLALEHKMAHEFLRLQLPIPPELAAAELSWSSSPARLFPPATLHTASTEAMQPQLNYADELAEETYDGAMAAIFVLPLRRDGRPISDTVGTPAPFPPELHAVATALVQNRDERTVRLATGARLRLLTYRLPAGRSTAVLQAGRALTDQDRVSHGVLMILLLFSAGSAVLVGSGSWWVAGRSLAPARQAWEQQQIFIANASHELRAPLTLVRAGAEVARRKLRTDDSAARPLLDDVLAECDHMKQVVEDLLLLSRLDAHHLPLTLESVDLPKLLSEIQRQIGWLVDERGIHLVIQAVPVRVWADATRLRQVLLIMLDNALRFTPRTGSITISTRVQQRTVEICIDDTGVGIGPEHLPHLFERFYQANAVPPHEDTGSGLGLAIAQGLMQAQHGSISITSQLGQGTHVCLTLRRRG